MFWKLRGIMGIVKQEDGKKENWSERKRRVGEGDKKEELTGRKYGEGASCEQADTEEKYYEEHSGEEEVIDV